MCGTFTGSITDRRSFLPYPSHYLIVHILYGSMSLVANAPEKLLVLAVDMCAYGEAASGVCHSSCSSSSAGQTLKSVKPHPGMVLSRRLNRYFLLTVTYSTAIY